VKGEELDSERHIVRHVNSTSIESDGSTVMGAAFELKLMSIVGYEGIRRPACGREDRVYIEWERLGYVFPPEPPGAADGEIPLTASAVA